MFVQICRSQRGRSISFSSNSWRGKARRRSPDGGGEGQVGDDGGPPRRAGYRSEPCGSDLLREERELGEAIRSCQRKILHVKSERRREELLERSGCPEAYRVLLKRIEREDDAIFSLVSWRGIDAPSLQALVDADTTLFATTLTTPSSTYGRSARQDSPPRHLFFSPAPAPRPPPRGGRETRGGGGGGGRGPPGDLSWKGGGRRRDAV